MSDNTWSLCALGIFAIAAVLIVGRVASCAEETSANEPQSCHAIGQNGIIVHRATGDIVCHCTLAETCEWRKLDGK